MVSMQFHENGARESETDTSLTTKTGGTGTGIMNSPRNGGIQENNTRSRTITPQYKAINEDTSSMEVCTTLHHVQTFQGM